MQSDKPVTSVSEFADRVAQATIDQSKYEPWFRGVKSSDYDLVPTLFRIEDGNHTSRYSLTDEDNLRHLFSIQAVPYLDAPTASDLWLQYFLMQHHGLPTRLLDWTRGALIALFFATQTSGDREADKDAAVWIMNPCRFNKKITEKEMIFGWRDKQASAYLPPIDEGNEGIPEGPIAIHAPLLRGRLSAQLGCFTLHGHKPDKIHPEDFDDGVFVKIMVSRSSCANLQKELRVLGVTRQTVFPELDSVCKDLLAWYEPWPS